MSEIALETKFVGAITGKFFIPSYQRGYRWGKEEVIRLLDDIYYNKNKNYCLQPIVVKDTSNGYELIDGQQRLTTIFLIYKYMNISSGGFLDPPKFSIAYETRDKSEEFLNTVNLDLRNDNIDFWFLANAYDTISEWFTKKDKKSVLTNLNKYFDENVKIIWYEVDEQQDSIELFTRLNIGKIPLTSSELVKAMFLCGEKADDNIQETLQDKVIRERKEEISLQWDTIEKELHHDGLWYFLTNSSGLNYQTRIDLILDMMAKKPENSKETYFTFFVFDNMRKNKDLRTIWREIQTTFLCLKDWYENHELYHKIGYLIAADVSLRKIYELSINKTKRQFLVELDGYISDSIKIDKNYGELSYENENDRRHIKRLLLLFNVESVRQNGEKSQWFPFDKFKCTANDGYEWSLEHIHAQKSEGMKTQEAWKEWLRLHIHSLQSLQGHDDLVRRMQGLIEKTKLERNEFVIVQEKVLDVLSVKGNTEYLHSISNLALLSTGDNAALSNSTFDVKRNEIVKMDQAGKYIPYCTKMVFLKYYTPSSENQIHFWGPADRAAYIQKINDVLEKYLLSKIVLEQEVK